MYIQSVSKPSFFSELNVWVKLLFLFLVSTLIFVWQNIFYLGALFLLVLFFVFTSHIDRGTILKLFSVLTPFLIIMILIQATWSPLGETPIATLPEFVPFVGGKLSIKWEGLVFGFVVALRLLSPVLAFPLVVMTTDVNDLVVGLVRLRVPFKIAFIFSITLRFVPFLFAEVNAIMDAQRLRGLALEKMNFFRRIPIFASLLVPLILGSLMKAQTLDIALQSKAFSGSRERTYLNEEAMLLDSLDYVLLAVGVFLLFGSIWTRLVWGWGSFVA